MTALRLTLAAAALSLTASLAPAATVGGYTSFLAFGDSLTDDGNLYDLTGGLVPQKPPYFDGRFSNGPTWAEHVAERFTDADLFSANLAFGGANAVTDGDFIPDLGLQLGLAAGVSASDLGTKPLASLWFGANDIFNEIDSGTSTLASVVAVARAAANAVGLAAGALDSAGISDLILFNLPDLGKIPRYALMPDPTLAIKATVAANAFNTRLDLWADDVRAGGARVIEIDIDSLFDDLISDPTQFGLTNATTPCFVPPSTLCSPQEAQDWAFFDQSHPNVQVHSIVAKTVLEAAGMTDPVAEVPLPASVLLLGAGLAGMAALRRRAA